MDFDDDLLLDQLVKTRNYNSGSKLTHRLLNLPKGITISKKGNIFVSDQVGQRIFKINQNLEKIHLFAGNGEAKNSQGIGSDASLLEPNIMTVDSQENVFVVLGNSKSNSIGRISSNGTFQILFSCSISCKFGHLTIDSSNSLYMTVINEDTNSFSVKVLHENAAQLVIVKTFTTSNTCNSKGTTDFIQPMGIAVDREKVIYISDYCSHNIKRYDIKTGVLDIFVGGSEPGFKDGNGTMSSFNEPHGLVYTDDGYLYVADKLNNAIRKIETATKNVKTISGDGKPGLFDGTGSNSQLNNPFDIAFDGKDFLYIIDLNNDAVRRVQLTSNLLTTFITPVGLGFDDGFGSMAQFARPWFIAYGSDHNLYISDEVGNNIRKVLPSGKVITFAGISGVSGFVEEKAMSSVFWSPSGLALDKENNLFVSDMRNYCIRFINQTSGHTSTFAGICKNGGSPYEGKFQGPRGMRFDEKGNLFIADSLASVIIRISSKNEFVIWAGKVEEIGTQNGFRLNARFQNPSDLTITKDGTIFIMDTGNNMVRKISIDGFVTTIAGTGLSGYKDGAGSQAQFSFPISITHDSLGNIIIPDNNNARIRKISSNDNVVSTIAGAVYNFRGGQSTKAFFRNPVGVCIDSNDNMYLTDPSSLTVFRFDNNSILQAISGKYSSRFHINETATSTVRYPLGLATHPLTGEIFITGAQDNAIFKLKNSMAQIFAGQGSFGYLDSYGNHLSAMFNWPLDIAFSLNGNILYVADSSNHVIRTISSDSVTTLIGSGSPGFRDGSIYSALLNNPSAIAVDFSGDIYIADTNNHRIRKVSLGNQTVFTVVGFSPSFEDGPFKKGRLKYPVALSLDHAKKRLLISDEGNHAIRVWNIVNQTLTTLAGNGTIGFTNGIGRSASFNSPKGLTVSRKGIVYVADSGNGVVRTIDNDKVSVLNIKSNADFPGLKEPGNLIFDETGALIVTDVGNDAVFRIAQKTLQSIQTGSDAYSLTNSLIYSAMATTVFILFIVALSIIRRKSKPETQSSSTSEKLATIGKKVFMGPNRTVTYTFSASKTLNVKNVIAIPGYLEMQSIDSDIAMVKKGKIGKGGTASVRKGTIISSEMIARCGKQDVAVKYFEIKNNDDSVYMFEVALMASLPKVANIVQLLGYCIAEKAIIMPFYPNSLDKFIKTSHSISSEKLLKIAHDITSGMKYLHDIKIVHLDLKPLNVLIDDQTFTCLICDFGFAHFLGDEFSVVRGLRKPLTAGLTYAYAAPELLDIVMNHEVLMHENDDELKMDVYAFGITMYEVYCLKQPWKDMGRYEIYDLVSDGKRPDFPKLETKNQNMINLINSAWAQSPGQRPSFAEIQNILSDMTM